MKKYLLFILVGIILGSCAMKVPYNDKLRDEFGLESVNQIKKVQFIVSSTIILQKEKESGHVATDEDGNLVEASNKQQNRIIIPAGTKCVFERFGEDGESLVVRFETGPGKVLTFDKRPGSTTGKYYFKADWSGSKGGLVRYGNETYMATPSSATAYLIVKKKKLQKIKRKDKVVKGMKV